MQGLLEKLGAHRRRIRIARTAETAVRWAFYASVLGCVYLTASKIAGLTVPRAAAATALVAIPLAMAAREWARRFSVRDCAVHLDRALGLDERLSTAVEGGGAMGGALAADAAGALARAAFPPRRLPREARLLAAGLLILLALLAIPSPSRPGAAGDPALEAMAAVEAARLEALGTADVELREVAALLRRGKADEALAKIQAARDRLAEKLLEAGGAGDAETKRLLDAAEATSAALGAELARAGRVLHAPPPRLADLKLARQSFPAPDGPVTLGGDPARVLQSAAAVLRNPDWDKRYDAVIRRYFGSEP